MTGPERRPDRRPGRRPERYADDGRGPVEALEDAVRPALLRPPCTVSFSGGLDSSLVLAVADRVARRDGLPRPVPVTIRAVDAPASREDEAQESVVRALGCPDWERIEVTDEADLVGPWAREVLSRHGMLHPFNVHLHLPMLELTGTGSLLTGLAGDQLLGGWRRPRVRRRPWWWPGRGPIGSRPAPAFTWLRPLPSAVVRRRIARERASQPRRFDRRISWHARRRDLRLTVDSLATLAAGTTAVISHPLAEPSFVASVARRGGAAGFGPPGTRSRARLLADVFGLLPPAVIAERRKATFNEVFWREATRELVSAWNGEGVDRRLVDLDGLRELWGSGVPAPVTALLVHQVWLAGQRCRPGPAVAS